MADIEMQNTPEKSSSEDKQFDSSNYVPSPFHSNLRRMLDRNNEDGFRKLIEQKNPNLDQLIHYNYFSDKSLLEMACFKGKSNFVKILLESGARVNYINKILKRAPIHIASENGHHNVIEVLMEHGTQLNVDLEADTDGSTALYFAVENQHIECVKTLLNMGANPNIPDWRGITPLYLAVKKGYNDIVHEIMTDREERVDIDIDSYYDIYSEKITTRELLLTKYPDIALPQQAERAINFYDVRLRLSPYKDDSFFENFDKITEINDLDKLIVRCSVQNIPRGIDKLLERKNTMSDDGLPPEALVAAIEHRKNKIIQKFFKSYPSLKVEGNSVMTSVLLRQIQICMGEKGTEHYKRTLECFNLILNWPGTNVRYNDCGLTPLHCVLDTEKDYDDEVIQRLLQLGSCIGHCNSRGTTPIDKLSPMSMSKYFDSCVRRVDQSKQSDDIHRKTIIEFDYKCLQPLPLTSADSVNFLRRDVQWSQRLNQLEMEMKPLKILCNKAHMKHLLHHPLLSSFITLKGYRIRKYLYTHILIYTIFCFLMGYCISSMAGMNNKRFNGPINGTFDGTFEEKILRNETRNGTIIGKFEGTTIAGFNGNISGSFDGTINEAINGTINGTIYGLFNGTTDGTLSLSVVTLVSYSLISAIAGILTVICLILLAIHEIIELLSIPVVYFQRKENWLEIILIIGSVSVISGALDLAYSSFILIFLAWKMIDMLQQFQRFSVSVQMLKIVSFNLLRHLVFYVLFVFAFALAFFTLFQNEYEHFGSVSGSLFKTIVMLTGEFDAGNTHREGYVNS